MAGDYREKIRKLLALAESSNEHEAKAALIKAHQLMAEHGLSVRDLREYTSQTVKKILTNIGYTKRRDPWIVLLSGILATNYCCKAYVSREKYKETKYIGFIANSHFLRPAGPHFPASQGHIKRSALEIGRARGAPPC